MEIYIDELFIINFIACIAMLFALGQIKRLPLNKVRLFIAAAAGGGIACIKFVFNNIPEPVFFAAEMLIMKIAFYNLCLKNVLLFTLFKYMFSAFSVLCVTALGGAAAVIRGGIIYFDINAKVFVFVFICTYILIYIFAVLIKYKKRAKYYTLKVKNGDKTVTVKALYDSGNLLKNPYNGKSVIVAEQKAITAICGKRFILIPYSAVGTDNGLMRGFMAESVFCVENGELVNDVTIGISENTLSKYGGTDALIGPGLFKEDL